MGGSIRVGFIFLLLAWEACAFLSPDNVLHLRGRTRRQDQPPLLTTASELITSASPADSPTVLRAQIWKNPKVEGKRLVTSTHKNANISDIKVRRTLSEMRGRSVVEALAILEWSPRRPGYLVWNLIKTALANARDIYGSNNIRPRIHSCEAHRGPKVRRARFAGRGRLQRYRRPRTHITVTLEV
uniref:Ribosomal protein L22 n=1 Tax=Chromera velia CCMP2878 TaxID=1169474 RepID=A0A0G4F1D7_9ALVE|eukprot:Cvel_2623.t1-p1 / transcript=Cvel_2623.t1 / gene=Cvel_2623 / organism=Chromera_velia_CCMP2878 / gene_product=50S ribosomal protein L22, chloroplastic, putative / transcript_product=50S ribosomal protein L22, chloroplastic, putative / location=Cvel_scaffold104:22202-22753(-) / protein_length=184 / sequence_SO=supercontig / SO=protein_coding / is_pseudo=false